MNSDRNTNTGALGTPFRFLDPPTFSTKNINEDTASVVAADKESDNLFCITSSHGSGHRNSYDLGCGRIINSGLNSAIFSPVSGTISYMGAGTNAGNMIIIDYDGGKKLQFMHLNGFSNRIYPEKTIVKGEFLGEKGNSGGSDGPHLHLETTELDDLRQSLGIKKEKEAPKDIGYALQSTAWYYQAIKGQSIHCYTDPNYSENQNTKDKIKKENNLCK